MSNFVIRTPTQLTLPHGIDERMVKSFLSYKDKRADYELRRLKDRPSWYISQMGEEGYGDAVQALADKAKGSLYLQGEEDQDPWTYSGLVQYLQTRFPNHALENKVSYPSPKPLPWASEPSPLRPYQEQAAGLLLAPVGPTSAFPRSVEMGTGLGKSRLILELLRELGLRAVVMAPSTSIAGQLYKQIHTALGGKYVGAYFDGKKHVGKHITVATAQSLTKINPEDRSWEHLSGAEVFVADESHMCPADTLARVCLGEYVGRRWVPGLCAAAPYRFFFSGTQIRGDGLELVLKGIIGDPLYTMTVREGVDQGWLARPHFCMITVESESSSFAKDPNKLTRLHLLQNPAVNQKAGELATRFANNGKPVLILVDELTQVPFLLPHLRVPFGLAHGGVTKDNKAALPVELHKSDPDKLVEEFNANKLPCLIGTSCIGTGTDIKPAAPNGMVVIYLVGGRSEIQLRQYVGRGTRRDGKNQFLFIDFDVSNVDVLHRHANDRRAIYEQIYAPAREMT